MARRVVAPVAEEAADEKLFAYVAGFADDPLGFVRAMFPWGKKGTILQDETGPDVWQEELLDRLGVLIRERKTTAAEAIRLAVASGHGVGKTTLVSWVILWFISTRQNPQIVVTANTAAQLTGKTWRELAKWHRLMLNADWFQWSATKFYLKWAPDTWFASAVPWSKERAEAFAGTHEKHVLVIFDEASAIEDIIWEVAEGAMTTPGAMWLCFGNPTRNTGRFRECWRRYRHRWVTWQVDSRKAKKAHQPQIEAWREDYGDDSDFFRIRVKGEFPRAASTQFIAEDVVEGARARFRGLVRRKRQSMGELADAGAPVVVSFDDVAEERYAPLIMAVDVARFGDDQTVVGLRKGRLFLVHARWRGLDLEQTKQRVAEAISSLRPDAVFVDEVGVGAGVVDGLRALGYQVEGVNGGLRALDERTYFNRRVEMWDLMRKWLKQGGMIEDDDSFTEDLTAPEYGFDAKGRFQLESKDDMRSRGLPSPDTADALSMTFFAPVASKETKFSASAWLSRFDDAGTTHMAF